MHDSKQAIPHTCFNSKCSEYNEENPSPLYEAVIKNLNNEYCPQHHRLYEYFYEGTLLCQSCFQDGLRASKSRISMQEIEKYEYLHNLKNIMKHPLILLANEQSLFQCPIPLLALILNAYHPLLSRKSDLSAQKQLLITFTNRIKAKVNSLCDTLLANFEAAQQHLSNINEYRDELKHVGKMYQQQFEQLLGQKYTQGTKQQLQDILNNYRCSNENPFDKLFTNLDEVMSHLSQTAIINTQQLVKLYTTVTDERLWKCNQLVNIRGTTQSNENNEYMILNSEEVHLQNEYVLQTNTEEGLILKKGDAQLGRLRQNFDSLYHLNKYRLIGVNYESIQIISYFDRLKIDQIFPIQGCTDVLPFENSIIVISNQNLIKIDLHTKRQTTLANNCKELKYDNTNAEGFICETTDGRRIRWSVKASDPCREFPL